MNSAIREFNAICKIADTPRLYNSYELLLDAIKTKDLEVDLIVLATPSGIHARQAISAAQLGVNVCTEKPMATSYQDAKDMLSSFDDNKRTLFVVKQNRFNPPIMKLKKAIDNKQFGRIQMISLTFSGRGHKLIMIKMTGGGPGNLMVEL